MFIIGHQKASLLPRVVKQRNQPRKISRRSPLPYHYSLPLAYALLGFIGRRAFMVISYSRGNVFIKRLARQKRSMTVYNKSARQCGFDFFLKLVVPGNHADIIHNLAEPENTTFRIEFLYIIRRENRTRFVKACCRNT